MPTRDDTTIDITEEEFDNWGVVDTLFRYEFLNAGATNEVTKKASTVAQSKHLNRHHPSF